MLYMTPNIIEQYVLKCKGIFNMPQDCNGNPEPLRYCPMSQVVYSFLADISSRTGAIEFTKQNQARAKIFFQKFLARA
jgi:hypothetical protein